MALGIALSSTHDIFIDTDNRRLALFTDSNLTGRNLNTRLRTVKGEYILDNLYGIDYTSAFLRKTSLLDYEATVKRVILATEGVDQIINFRFENEAANPRKLILNFAITTIYGDELIMEGITIG